MSALIAYFDCFSGISGDMTLGALLDAGLPIEEMQAELGKVAISGYKLQVQKVVSKGVSGTQVSVKVHEPQEHRQLATITDLIQGSGLSPRVREQAVAIFRRLAEAEAAVHGTSVEDVHFHEVGAVDAIVDIVGACVGLEKLGVSQVYASPLPTGSGTVRCAHGLLPVPAPATLELLRRASAPLRSVAAEGEMVTPTGAAILATLATFSQPLMRLQRVGYGFGRREFPWPNALRLWLGQPLPSELDADQVSLLEANLDDTTPELLGAAMDSLFAGGALDVFFTPIQMKKNRPAVKLSVIAPLEREAELAERMLLETSTLGVRYQRMARYKAQRWLETVETPWGPVQVKVKAVGERRSASPEYEDCRRVAQAHGLPVWEVWQAVQQAAEAVWD